MKKSVFIGLAVVDAIAVLTISGQIILSMFSNWTVMFVMLAFFIAGILIPILSVVFNSRMETNVIFRKSPNLFHFSLNLGAVLIVLGLSIAVKDYGRAFATLDRGITSSVEQIFDN